MKHLFGIDLGGTKIEAAVINPEAPDKPICRMRVPTESERGYEHIISQVAKVCGMVAAESGLAVPSVIGIGTPGITDPTSGTLKNSNTQCLNGRPFRQDLEAALNCRLVMANDANCLALAETVHGAAKGYETVFGVIIGTGVGGGVVVNGRVLNGAHGLAGEWGQIVLDPNGPLSNYGTRGTIEAILAGPALERFYAALAGEKKPLKEIVARAGSGADASADATITHLTDRFAEAIATIVTTLDPHAFVLGGGVGNVDALYTEETRDKIRQRVFGGRFETPLLKPILGDSAGVFGAAMLAAG